VAGAIETRLAQLERRLARREDPGAEIEQRRREELTAAAAAFDSVDTRRSELRDQHRAVLTKIRAILPGLGKNLADLRAIEEADYEPYMTQYNACQHGADRQRRGELGGSYAISEALDRVEQLVREMEATR